MTDIFGNEMIEFVYDDIFTVKARVTSDGEIAELEAFVHLHGVVPSMQQVDDYLLDMIVDDMCEQAIEVYKDNLDAEGDHRYTEEKEEY